MKNPFKVSNPDNVWAEIQIKTKAHHGLSKEESDLVMRGEISLEEMLKKKELKVVDQLKELRKLRGLSQQQLADKSGIKSIGQIERGNVIPSIPTIMSIASALNAELVIHIKLNLD